MKHLHKMDKPKILLCTNDSTLSGRFAESVKGAGELVISSKVAEHKHLFQDFSLVIVDESLLQDGPATFGEAQSGAVIVRGDLKSSIHHLKQLPMVQHILAASPADPQYWRYLVKSYQVKSNQLGVTTGEAKVSREVSPARQLLLEPDYFETRNITSYVQKDQYLNWVRQQANSLGCFSDFGNMAASIAWELLMNACSRQSYLGTGKVDDSVLFEPGEKTYITLGYDQDVFVISVQDPFGLLRRNEVVDNLWRCGSEGDNQVLFNREGAGIGLYMLLGCASYIVFDVCENTSTDVTVAMRRTKSNKYFDEQTRSISFIKRAYHKDL